MMEGKHNVKIQEISGISPVYFRGGGGCHIINWEENGK